MRLKYKILWFEDDEDVIKEDPGPAIREFLTELGFRLEIVHKFNGEELAELIKDRNYDLIVTDLNLGEHEAGDKLIEHVRDGLVLTEVLLYSADANGITEIVANKGWVERASYCAGIGNLKEKLKEIISLTVKKNQDVNNTRGLVIAETIDLEKKIEAILLKYFDAAAELVMDENKKRILEGIHTKKLEKHQSDIEVLKAIKFTEIQLLIEKDILTAANSFDAIQSILKGKLKEVNVALSAEMSEDQRADLNEKMEALTVIKDELNNFRDEILKIRNTLAHVKEEVGEDGIPFLSSMNKDGAKIKFDSATYIAIRKNLLKHSNNLDRILEHIS